MVETKKESKNIKRIIFHFLFVILGCLILAFGVGIFLTQNTIVAGGLTGIAFIANYYLADLFGNIDTVVDIVVWICNIVLWIISFFVLGKTFALRTAVASFAFPAFLSMFTRVEVFVDLANLIGGIGVTETIGDELTVMGAHVGYLLLCGICGGICVGLGLSLTFTGKGSTGGIDVITFIINKYFGVRVSLASLCADACVVLTAIICFSISDPDLLINCLVGVISSIVCSMVVEAMYSKRQNAFLLHVITDKHEEVKEYILNKVERGVTIIPVTGGYTNTDRVMLEVVLGRNEYIEIKDAIAKIDPNAFMTFTDTTAVYGQGFKEIFGASYVSKNKKAKKDKTE